jgi:hypothetical protein
MPATIERSEGAKFSTKKKQILIAGMLAYHPACDAGRQIAFQ